MHAKRSAITLLAAVVAILTICPAIASADAGSNPIVRENQLPGSSGWQIGTDHPVADDAIGQIKGYASATSVAHGETLALHVSVNRPQAYAVDVYRLGWYGGLGGRLMRHDSLAGTPQPACPVDPQTGLIECRWAPSLRLTIPDSWTTGVYVAVLTNADRFQNYVIFVVRDDRRPAPLLYQMGVMTSQAYNDYPADGARGKSLYDYNSYGPATALGTQRAVKVSFDRPYSDDGDGRLISTELHFVRWLERSGFDVTYSTDVDTHAQGARLREHRAFLSVSHDEYWTKAMFDAAQAARDAGVNLGFFGANAVYWQVRFERAADGTPDRIMVCYKDPLLDPVEGITSTVRWRDPPVHRPEQSLVGVMYGAPVQPNVALRVINTGSWVYQGSGFTDGATVPGIVGDEADWLSRAYPPPPALSYTTLSSSPLGTGGPPSESAVYQAPSGAWVFAAGTISWPLGLDGALEDPRLQRTTANVLDRFVAVPPPVSAGGAGGGAGPPTVIAARVTARWRVRGSRTSIRKLLIRRVPSDGATEFRCTGRRCPLTRRRGAPPHRGTVNLLAAFTKQRTRFRAGQALEVRITANGRIGEVVRYRLRKGRIPKARRLCLLPGARSPRAC